MERDRWLHLLTALGTSALLGCAGRTPPQTQEVEPATGISEVGGDAHVDDADDDATDDAVADAATDDAAPVGEPAPSTEAVAEAPAPKPKAKAKAKAKTKSKASKGEAACGEGTCG